MRCLYCRHPNVSVSADECPNCHVRLQEALRNVLPPGASLQERRFEIIEPLGSGGFGITYLARHSRLNFNMAIKEYLPRDFAFRDGRQVRAFPGKETLFQRGFQRFFKEGGVLAQIRHPNVVRVSDLFEENNTAYLVMEHVDGDSLHGVVVNRPQWPKTPGRVLDVLRQLAGALGALHAEGIFHLDLKPDNILVTPSGQIVLIDFGAARTGMPASGNTRLLTMEYAPPELVRNEAVGPESDVYEVGVILFELLTGKLPPSSAVRLGPVPNWRPTDAPAEWQETIALALELERTRRAPSVQQLVETFTTPGAPRPIVHIQPRTLVGPQEQYRTITEALRAAMPGSQIFVRRGTYTEPLVIRRNVTIIADGPPGEVVIEQQNENCLQVVGGIASLIGLTLVQRAGSRGNRLFCADIVAGSVELHDCELRSEALACIAIHNQTTRARLVGCHLFSSGSAGARVFDAAEAQFERCVVNNHAGAGVDVRRDARATLVGCRVSNQRTRPGVVVRSNGSVEIRGGSIADNGDHGVSVLAGGQANIEGCDLLRNRGAGLFVYSGGRASVRHCHAADNHDGTWRAEPGGQLDVIT